VSGVNAALAVNLTDEGMKELVLGAAR
jgi:hypothetical protein